MTNALAPIDAHSIDKEAILKSLNLNPRDPNTQALLLVCDRYQLDPLLKHMVLIQGNPYVTRDGYLAIAHRSGQFDGMEVLEQGETKEHYTAKVAVYRKDMDRPFAFVGRFPKSKSMAKEYGPEMAVKVAEVQALRRAFNVTGVGAADEQWDTTPPTTADRGDVIDVAPDKEDVGELGPAVSNAERDRLRARIEALPDDYRSAVGTKWKEQNIGPLTRPDQFTPDDFKKASQLLDEFEDAVTAAEQPH